MRARIAGHQVKNAGSFQTDPEEHIWDQILVSSALPPGFRGYGLQDLGHRAEFSEVTISRTRRPTGGYVDSRTQSSDFLGFIGSFVPLHFPLYRVRRLRSFWYFVPEPKPPQLHCHGRQEMALQQKVREHQARTRGFRVSNWGPDSVL